MSTEPVEEALADQPPLLTPKQLAELRGTTQDALACERWKGSGPPFIKANGRVRYLTADVAAWLAKHRHDPESALDASMPRHPAGNRQTATTPTETRTGQTQTRAPRSDVLRQRMTRQQP